MEFEKILLDLHAILDRARNLSRQYEVNISSMKSREAFLQKQKDEVDAKYHDIEARDIECKKVENAQKLMKDAQNLHNSANLRTNALAEAERAHKQYVATENANIDNNRQLMVREAAAVEKQKKAIEDEVSKRVQAVLKTAGK